MDCLVHEFAKSWTQLSDFHISFVLIIYPGSSLEKVSPFLGTAAFNQAAFLLSRRKVREVESVSVCHCKLQLIQKAEHKSTAVRQPEMGSTV